MPKVKNQSKNVDNLKTNDCLIFIYKIFYSFV